MVYVTTLYNFEFHRIMLLSATWKLNIGSGNGLLL